MLFYCLFAVLPPLLWLQGKIQGCWQRQPWRGSTQQQPTLPGQTRLAIDYSLLFLCFMPLQGKIQGFGSGGPGEAAARSSSGHYGGIGSSGSNMGSGSYSGGFRSSGSSGLAAAQQAASQLTHAAQQALGEGPIAQGLASAANAIGGLLQPAGYGSRLNVSTRSGV